MYVDFTKSSKERCLGRGRYEMCSAGCYRRIGIHRNPMKLSVVNTKIFDVNELMYMSVCVRLLFDTIVLPSMS